MLGLISCHYPDLSGGQKQRVNIARALYFDADIVLLDDPLSAVDAHVGQALFTNAIVGAMKNRGKTVILVTHALHFLHEVDYVYTMVDGQIAEHGTFEALMNVGGAFSKLITEFGGEHERKDEDNEAAEEKQMTRETNVRTAKAAGKAAGTGKLEGRLIIAEKRTTGSVKLNGQSAKLVLYIVGCTHRHDQFIPPTFARERHGSQCRSSFSQLLSCKASSTLLTVPSP